MKRIKNCILVLLGAVMTSCNALDLGPEDFYSINNYWNSAEQCERFMIGLHYRLRERAETMWLMGESLSLRNKGCKSSICEIYTLFYTQECKIGCFCIF